MVDLPLPEGDTTALAIEVTWPHFEPLEWRAGADDVTRLNASESVCLLDLLGAIAVVVALAFGLGGREAAARELEEWLQSVKGSEKSEE